MFSQYAVQHAWLIPLLPVVAFVVIGFFLRRCPRPAAGLAIGMSLASFLLALGVGYGVFAGSITVDQPWIQKIPWLDIAGIFVSMGVYLDPLTAMMLMVVSLVSLLVQIYSIGYMAGDEGFARFFAFLSLFAASMLGLVIAVNFVQLYVFWELVGLCSYLLIGFYFDRISAREAAKKAFMTTRIGDFGLLLGILLLQVVFGTVDFQQLAGILPLYIQGSGIGLLTVAALLIFMGPLSKSGQFPLHVWLPDAMEGPTPVSALIHAATMVVAGVYLVARVFFLFSLLPNVMEIIAWIGAFTACFAALVAVSQTDTKRILAYSTISQLGYMMLALGVGSVTASMFHLMTHAFFKAALFLGAGAIMHGLHGQTDIFAMGGLRRRLPVTFAVMTIGVLAISGIPPFAGFFSKDEILAATAHVSGPLYGMAVLTALLTAFYMGRLLFVAFFGREKQGNMPHEAGPAMCFSMIVLSVLAVVSGAAGYMAHFGEWVRFGPALHEDLNLGIASFSTFMSVLGLGAAWLLYGRRSVSPDQLALKLGFFYTLSYNKFFIDEFYGWLNRTFVYGTGKILYWLDIKGVDGLVNGLAWSVGHLGDELRRIQTGQLQQYGVVIFTAIMLIAAWVVFSSPIFVAALQRGAY